MLRGRPAHAHRNPVVGVVGLGRMGLPIGARLCAAGFSVIGTDRRQELAPAVETAGVRWVDDIAGLARATDVVITVLPGPAAVREVLEPVVAHLRPGGAWIDMSSGVPVLSEEIRAQAEGRIRTLECPVGGNPDAARAGELLGYLGAEEIDATAQRPLLEQVCREFVHVGPPGTGYAVKLLVNLLWFEQALAVSEVLSLAARIGLDPDQVRDTLTRGPAASRFLEQDAGRLLQGDDMTTFGLDRCLEELEGTLELAHGRGMKLTLAELVTDVYAQALSHYGAADGELLAARRVAERLGVSFGDPPRRGS